MKRERLGRLETGIVHFGPGAFHRAHQADYLDRLADHDPRWAIAAVSLRSGGTIDALLRQDGLYTLAILDEQASFRPIGVHNRFYGPDNLDSLPKLFGDPGIRAITSTVTEKGYCLAPDGTLDFSHPDVVRDLAGPGEPSSLVGWIANALAVRRADRLPPLTVICCDNMTSNGRKLGAAVAAFAHRLDPELGRWIEGEVRFPDTMVDSITPATDDGLRALVLESTGFNDDIPVRREAFAQWVVEDALPADGPDLASVGAIVTGDVAAWEKAKLRILNGSHSALAYLGLLLGHETVADAMDDTALRGFVERLIAEDFTPSLEPSPIDLAAYARDTLARFRNPAIHHKLSQIAWDGSQKLPYRQLDTAIDALAAGRPVDRLAVPLAAWILFLERQFGNGAQVIDPLAEILRPLALGPDPVGAILGVRQVFAEGLGPSTPFANAVARAHDRMKAGDIGSFLANLAA